jgi:hypothetical protein
MAFVDFGKIPLLFAIMISSHFILVARCANDGLGFIFFIKRSSC